MAAPFTLREMRVVMAIIRLTYGWNKKADRIADSQIAEVCHLPRQKVNRIKQQLSARCRPGAQQKTLCYQCHPFLDWPHRAGSASRGCHAAHGGVAFLVAKRVLKIEGAGHGLLSLNKHFDEWDLTAFTPRAKGGVTKGVTLYPTGVTKTDSPRTRARGAESAQNEPSQSAQNSLSQVNLTYLSLWTSPSPG